MTRISLKVVASSGEVSGETRKKKDDWSVGRIGQTEKRNVRNVVSINTFSSDCCGIIGFRNTCGGHNNIGFYIGDRASRMFNNCVLTFRTSIDDQWDPLRSLLEERLDENSFQVNCIKLLIPIRWYLGDGMIAYFIILLLGSSVLGRQVKSAISPLEEMLSGGSIYNCHRASATRTLWQIKCLTNQ